MFSTRTDWNRTPNRISLLLDERRRSGEPFIDLTASNPTRCEFDYPPDLLTGLADPGSFTYEPHPRGALRARESIAGYYAKRKLAVHPEEIILTASTSEAYSFIFRLLADPYEEILVPHPSYPLFEFLANVTDVHLKPYALSYEAGWRLDFESLKNAIGPKSRAVLIVNPNNPTGSFLHQDEVPILTDFCKRHSLPLIVDEVFCDYAFTTGLHSMLNFSQTLPVLTFVLNGLSKLVGLPQLKLSWICAKGPPSLVDEALERLDVISDTFLSVNTPVQNALPSLLAEQSRLQGQILARVLNNYESLAARARLSNRWECLALEGGWYAVVTVPQINSEEEWVLRLLDRDGVLVHPGYFFDFEAEGFVVLSLLPPTNLFREGVDRLALRIEADSKH